MTKPQTKSPFIVYPDFLSPAQCEQVIDDLNFLQPDYDPHGKPIRQVRHLDAANMLVYGKITPNVPSLETHYGFNYKGMTPVEFEWYPQGVGQELHSENSSYLRGKWVRTKLHDFTGVIFLKDHVDGTTIDTEFEMYGGRMEFPQHKFTVNPIRGTLIIFPSAPHFINTITPTLVGDNVIGRFHIHATTPHVYQPADFPGDYRTWF